MRCEEAQELITALVDNELAAAETPAVEAHLKDCSKCQFIYREERALKRKTRMVGASLSAPDKVRKEILSDLSLFSERAKPRSGWLALFSPSRSILGPAYALAVVILLALPVLYLMQPGTPPVAISALEIHEKIVQGTVSLVKAGSQEEVKEWLSRSVQGRFAPMGYDLSMMKLRAVGGVVEDAGGRKILVAVYEGEGPSVTCYTFLGTEQDAPKGSGVVFDPEKKINFYVFSHGGVNGVLHREGSVICILVSRMPMSDLLEVARSKARSA